MKLWNEMNEAERDAFMASDAYNDPTNPARVPWGEWSDAAVGAVWRAHQKGKQVQYLSVCSWKDARPSWHPPIIYRIPPEPKRETVQLTGYEYLKKWSFSHTKQRHDTHSIHFPTLDGNPVLDKCPHCGTAPIDMEEL